MMDGKSGAQWNFSKMDLINYLLPKIEHFQYLGYWVVLLVSLLESLAFIGIVVPGSTFVK